MHQKTKIQLLVGVIVTAVIFYYTAKLLRDLELSVVFHWDINWGFAAVSMMIYIYANYVRGLAYTHGIDPEIDHMTAFEIVGIGHTLNMVLPLHAGEGIRAAFFPSGYSALRRTKLLIIPAFADLIAIMLISAISVPFVRFSDPNLLKAIWILSLICIGACILIAALAVFVPKLHGYFYEYFNWSLAKMMAWVILSWLFLLVSTWLGLVAFGFDAVGAIRLSLAVFAATNIINFIPASPGAIGLFEYGTILGLSGLGVDRATALSAGLLLHLMQYVALLPLGVFLYMHALHGKYGDVLRSVWHKRGSKKPDAKIESEKNKE